MKTVTETIHLHTKTYIKWILNYGLLLCKTFKNCHENATQVESPDLLKTERAEGALNVDAKKH